MTGQEAQMKSKLHHTFRIKISRLRGAVRSWMLLILVGMVVHCSKPSNSVEASKLEWNHRLNAAVEQAQGPGKKIFTYVSAQWCAECRQVRRELLHSSKFSQFVEEHGLILLELDLSAAEPEGSQANALADRFGIHTIPAFMILDPDGSRKQSRETIVGYRNPDEALASFGGVLDRIRYRQAREQLDSPVADQPVKSVVR